MKLSNNGILIPEANARYCCPSQDMDQELFSCVDTDSVSVWTGELATQHCCNNDCDPLNAMNAECNPPSSGHQRCEADKKELEVFG